MISAILLFLKGVPVRVWETLAVVALIGLYSGFLYHAGGKAPRAALASLEASIKNAQRLHDLDDKRKAAESVTAINQREAEHAKQEVATTRAWSDYVNGLPKPASAGSSGAGAKPAPTVASVICNDPAKDAILSAAIQGYRDEIESAVGELRAAEIEYRRGVAFLLEQADKQVAQLLTLQAEVNAVAEVNR